MPRDYLHDFISRPLNDRIRLYCENIVLVSQTTASPTQIRVTEINDQCN